MKTKDEHEKTTRSTVPFPVDLWEKVKKEAKLHRRSANDELIFVLGEYFDEDLVRLEPSIKTIVAEYAKAKGRTITEATNYLVTTKISALEEIEDKIIAETNKDYEKGLSNTESEVSSI